MIRNPQEKHKTSNKNAEQLENEQKFNKTRQQNEQMKAAPQMFSTYHSKKYTIKVCYSFVLNLKCRMKLSQ